MSRSPFARHWQLDASVVFLNHGSFGACPTPVLERQQELRDELEREPVRFMLGTRESLLAEARQAVAGFIGGDAENLVFLRNATAGVNAVLRSLELGPEDELLTTDQAYSGCRSALDFVLARTGATLNVARLPFPLTDPNECAQAIVDAVTKATRLAFVDHVTSITGLVLPIADIVRALHERGVPVLVDGAHAPGMVPLELDALGADYYAANFHKWLCSPKGAGMLYVRPEHQRFIHPGVVSHGYRWPESERFRAEFDWPGTDDPTPWLALPEAIRFMGSLMPGGWDELRAKNRELALEAQRLLAQVLGVPLPAPASMIGALAAVPLPPSPDEEPTFPDSLQRRFFDDHNVELLIGHWPAHPERVLRLSTQLYNTREDVALVANLLPKLLAEESG